MEKFGILFGHLEYISAMGYIVCMAIWIFSGNLDV
jgi:hypothetical protein